MLETRIYCPPGVFIILQASAISTHHYFLSGILVFKPSNHSVQMLLFFILNSLLLGAAGAAGTLGARGSAGAPADKPADDTVGEFSGLTDAQETYIQQCLDRLVSWLLKCPLHLFRSIRLFSLG